MPTAPFGATLEALVKLNDQGAIFNGMSGGVISPHFFCCISGTSVGVYKDPVAVIKPDSGTQVCTCQTVTVDYSDSWSPSATLLSWSVNWGDGNVTNGAFPGAGTTSHPGGCGGYAIAGTYTITLTVVDQLGAEGTASFQVDVVNCNTYATIEMFCSTDGLGNPIWFSNDAGGNWADRSGHVLAGACAYDLKINPFSVPVSAPHPTDNTDNLWLWTATDFGLYNCFDGARQGNSWGQVDMPIEIEIVRSVCPSKADKLEIFILGSNLANNRVWLCRSIDYGSTWTSLELLPLAGFYQLPTYGWTHSLDMSRDGLYLYVGLLSDALDPVVLRVPRDLSSQTVLLSPGGGSWLGVRADPCYGNLVWIFGSTGAGPTVYVSEDWGTTLDDASPWVGSCSANPQVLPLLMSIYNPADAFALDNDGLETAITGNFGLEWTISALAAPFICQCGERGWYDDRLIFVGARNVGANHLQLSIDRGIAMWTERSGGLPATVPVTAIQIFWEHGVL